MYQQPVVAGTPQELSAKITDLQAKAGDLKLRLSDLDMRRSQLTDQQRRMAADVDHSAVDKQIASVQHDFAATQIQLEQITAQIKDLDAERDMARAFSLQGPAGIATNVAPPAFPEAPWASQIPDGLGLGLFVLLVPFAIALSRRIWHRSAPRTIDLENSPRLQRMEQAIESIAVEVERIGEAQRFTTKLLAERQPEAIPRVATPKREAGTVTPH